MSSGISIVSVVIIVVVVVVIATTTTIIIIISIIIITTTSITTTVVTIFRPCFTTNVVFNKVGNPIGSVGYARGAASPSIAAAAR